MNIAIIGGGAAGCFAAANIAKTAAKVTIYEKNNRLLQKVKVSGGGRCNVTHDCVDVPELVDKYPRGKQLLKKSLYHFSPEKTVEWFNARGVSIKTEADGRMFPDTDSSQTIIDCIHTEMLRQHVQVAYHHQVVKVEKKDAGFTLHFAEGKTVYADKVLIAGGGAPKPDAYNWVGELGHTINPPVPSLFTFNMPGNNITTLMGLSVPNATVKIAGTKFTEHGPLLITHWGMSGPAILRTSAWAARDLNEKEYKFKILVNWLGDVTEEEVKDQLVNIRKEKGKVLVVQKNPFDLPARLWMHFLEKAGVAEGCKWGELPATAQNKLLEQLIRDLYEVQGKTTFKEEFVTCGGVKLSEIDPQTMESRIIPGLYFAGEIMDVDGITGGFNFQHAWSSAWIAAQSMVASAQI